MDTITLNFTNYTIKGVALILDWSGQTGSIIMDTITVDNIENLSIKDLNDGGFGCQEIKGAYLTIYKNYQGYLVADDDKIVGDLSDDEINFLCESYYL